MANDAGDLIDAADLESPNLNPAYSLDPTYGIRAVPLTTKEVFPETSSALLAPLSTTYTPPGTRIASLAAVPGQPVNMLQGADLSVPKPEVRPVIPAGSEAPQVQLAQLAQNGPPVAPPQRAPSAAPGSVRPLPPPGPTPYAQPNAPETDTDQKEMDQLKLDADRLRRQGTGWFNNLVNESEAKDAQKQWHEKMDKIGEVQKRIDAKAYNRELAKNSGVVGPVSSTEDAASLYEKQKQEWAEKGNFSAYRAMLGSGHADNIKIYDADGFNALGKDTAKAAEAFSLLDKDGSENDYRKNRAQALEKSKDVFNAKVFGLTDANLPLTKQEWMARRKEITATKNDATLLVTKFQNDQENRSVPKPVMDEKAAAAITSQFRLSNKESMRNLDAVTMENGQIAARGSGEKDLGKFGVDFHDGTPKDVETLKTQMGTPAEKDALQAFTTVHEFYKIANNPEMYKTGVGAGVVVDSVLSIGRDLAEGAKAAGTVGFAKVLNDKLGGFEAFTNTFAANNAGYINWVKGGAVGPEPPLYMSAQTIKGIKDIANFKMEMATEKMVRMNGAVSTAGRYGIPLNQIGLDDEAQKIVKPVWERAVQQTRLDKDSYPSIIKDDDRYYLPKGTKGPGVLPAGSYRSHVQQIIDNAARPAPPPPPVVTPPQLLGNVGPGQVQRVTAPPPGTPPPSSAPSSFGGRFDALGGVTTPPSTPIPPVPPPAAAPGRRSMLDSLNPISPARAEDAPAPDAEAVRQTGLAALRGQQPAAPAAPAPAAPVARGQQPAAPAAPAASGGYNPQTYNAGLERGESGGRNLPPNSAGASGYHQFIKETWNANKPAGAPDEAYKATREQQDQARDNFTAKNSMALSNSGIPVNNFTLAVAHNLGAGEGGAKTLLTAPDNDTALKYVNRASAAGNPQFFWENGNGRLLTVAESKAKYADFYQTGGVGSAKPIGDMSLSELHKEARERKAAGLPQRGEADKSALQGIVRRGAVDAIPAAAQTAGQIAGGAVGGPVGAMAGGAIARGIADPARDYLSGDLDKQDASSLALSAGGGAVQGALESTPFGGVAGVGSRVIGAPAVAGLTDYLQTGDVNHALNKGGATAIGSVAGEVAGAGINKIVGPYLERLPIRDHGPVKNAAEVIATQKAVTIDAAGNQVGNPAYMSAEAYLRGKGIDPKRIASDYEATAKGPTEFGPAVIKRPAEAARLDAAHELQQVPNAVGAAHAATPSGQRAGLNARIGRDVVNPVDAVISDTNPHGTIPRGFEAEAKTAQDEMFKPSTNYGQAIDNMATARSNLLEEIRKTKEIPREAGKDYAQQDARIRGLTAISDHIRTQQETVIKHTLPPAQADALIEHLHQAGERYAKAMEAGRKDIVSTIAKGGQNGNDAKNAFMAVAKGDPVAERWINAMVEAEKNKGGKAKDIIYILGSATAGANAIPFIGTPTGKVVGSIAAGIGLYKAKSLLENYMTMKAAGKMVDFSQLVRDNVTPFKSNIQSGMSTLGGTVAGDYGDSLARKPTPQNRGAKAPISQ